MSQIREKPLRLLVVCPSWVGDVVMATPALRLIRRSLPGCFIGLLARPGLDEILAGLDVFDEIHVARSQGVMGPKFVAAKIRPRRYDTTLLLTNSFSTALIARIAGIPRRIGYDRDARGLLLTQRLSPPAKQSGGLAVVPAVEYYLRAAAEGLLHIPMPRWEDGELPMELAVTDLEQAAGNAVLAGAGVDRDAPRVVLNPGGNNAAKRWPAERFAELAHHLVRAHGLTVLLNGSPGEAELLETIRGAVPAESRGRVVSLATAGVTLGSLKAVVRGSRLMVTNDTGPRHIAAAFGVPLVSLFGPTDHRWTLIPTRAGSPELILLADPTLPESEVSNDHPERCSIARIGAEDVIEAVDRQLAGSPGPVTARTDCRTGRPARPSAEPRPSA
jgi:heptosyltransferase-2